MKADPAVLELYRDRALTEATAGELALEAVTRIADSLPVHN
jgi:hypothetical protein